MRGADASAVGEAAERAALLRLTERTRLGQMFALVRATTQMLKGYCDIEGNRCTVGPKGFGTITIIDENDNGSIEYPMEYTWNSCLDEHHTKTGDPDYCGESYCSACCPRRFPPPPASLHMDH